MKIYNTLTQQKEEFKSIDPDHVKIYLCGPTVYDLVHVGNMRGPIVFNYVVNYFKYKGKKVTFVYNYTDVDDRIIAKSVTEKISAIAVADRYIAEFEKDFAAIGLDTFKGDPLVKRINPRVTETIPEIIELIEDIIKNGAAYVVDGEVFCAIEKIKDYGKLSHKNIEELVAGARVQIGEKKKNPLDFSLWKPAKPGEISWPSPWGTGRPGWHIECSAMSKKYLGETFDIHGGGIDLIFPHHENEIAQSESGNHKHFANYWMHNNFINMGKDKMSKSLGNVFTARNFVEKYNGEILKFQFLSAHYRSPSDFTATVINHSISGLGRIYSALARADKNLQVCLAAAIKPEIESLNAITKDFWKKVEAASEDDFNSPEVIAEVFNQVRQYNNFLKPNMKASQQLANNSLLLKTLVQGVGKLMGLFNHSATEFLAQLDDMLLKEKNLQREAIQKRVDYRMNARKQKDFKISDAIRDELIQLGIELRDSVESTEWEVKK